MREPRVQFSIPCAITLQRLPERMRSVLNRTSGFNDRLLWMRKSSDRKGCQMGSHFTLWLGRARLGGRKGLAIRKELNLFPHFP